MAPVALIGPVSTVSATVFKVGVTGVTPIPSDPFPPLQATIEVTASTAPILMIECIQDSVWAMLSVDPPPTPRPERERAGRRGRHRRAGDRRIRRSALARLPGRIAAARGDAAPPAPWCIPYNGRPAAAADPGARDRPSSPQRRP